MAALKNSRRERFVEHLISGATATAAYISAGYSSSGAAQSAQRLLQNAQIKARKAELEERVTAGFVAGQIAERQCRLQMYQDVVDRILALLDERAVAYRDLAPGGATGLLVRRVRMIGTGNNARCIEEYRFDRAVLVELRKYLKQAAIEVGEGRGEQKPEQIPQAPQNEYEQMTPEELYAEREILLRAKAEIDALRAKRGHPVPLPS